MKNIVLILVLLGNVYSQGQVPSVTNATEIGNIYSILEAQATLIDSLQAKLTSVDSGVVFTKAQIKYLRKNFMNMPGTVSNALVDKIKAMLDALDRQIIMSNEITDQNSKDVSNVIVWVAAEDSTIELNKYKELRKRAAFLKAQNKKSLREGYDNALPPLKLKRSKVIRLK